MLDDLNVFFRTSGLAELIHYKIWHNTPFGKIFIIPVIGIIKQLKCLIARLTDLLVYNSSSAFFID